MFYIIKTLQKAKQTFSFSDFSGDSTSLSEFPPVEERSGPEGAEEDAPDSSQRHKDDVTTEDDDDSVAHDRDEVEEDDEEDEDDEECKILPSSSFNKYR